MQQYRCYGLNINSDQPIIGLNALNVSAPADIEVHWHAHEDSALHWQYTQGKAFRKRPRVKKSTATNDDTSAIFYRFEYNVAEFGTVTSVINLQQKKMWLDFPKTMTKADRCSLFLGTIIGSILRLKGYLCLHSSVLNIDGKALLLIGDKYAGKSTTAAALHRYQGVSLIADDIAVLQPCNHNNNHFRVVPGYPAFRLHSDVVQHLTDAESDTLSKVYSHQDKQYLTVANTSFENEQNWHTPVPVYAMCLLNGSTDPATVFDLKQIPANQGLLQLTAHTYANYAVSGNEMIRQEFNALSTLLMSTPLSISTYHKTMNKLDALCEALINMVRTLEIQGAS